MLVPVCVVLARLTEKVDNLVKVNEAVLSFGKSVLSKADFRVRPHARNPPSAGDRHGDIDDATRLELQDHAVKDVNLVSSRIGVVKAVDNANTQLLHLLFLTAAHILKSLRHRNDVYPQPLSIAPVQ
ncbi:MAG: hypothetical protein M1830_001681 [Pleopsidium flavum]|nr:MAG: hypothetical protein M1830_001681 [Pleopsidium flavum]